uniref:Uncharacterized protein TCIL3000_11_11430 n=1 Tax=Trypanosoma congolense (strain IL3000) TaxID=1068625 RepID=G0V1Y3_TRYCI|nr:unnamed protein product [Trypanosoma congolense IL3000]
MTSLCFSTSGTWGSTCLEAYARKRKMRNEEDERPITSVMVRPGQINRVRWEIITLFSLSLLPSPFNGGILASFRLCLNKKMREFSFEELRCTAKKKRKRMCAAFIIVGSKTQFGLHEYFPPSYSGAMRDACNKKRILRWVCFHVYLPFCAFPLICVHISTWRGYFVGFFLALPHTFPHLLIMTYAMEKCFNASNVFFHNEKIYKMLVHVLQENAKANGVGAVTQCWRQPFQLTSTSCHHSLLLFVPYAYSYPDKGLQKKIHKGPHSLLNTKGVSR